MKMMGHSRKLLLLADDDEEEATSSSSLRNNLSPSITYSPDPELLPPLNTSSSGATASGSPELTTPNSPFDSSTALTILVLLTALFFMAFFSIYIRRVSDDAADLRRRRRHHSPPSSSASSSLRFRPSKGRGLDPSTIGSLPLIAYSRRATQLIDCVICLSEFEERETLKMIPSCRHVFHPGCIDTWLTSHVSCPLCRSTKMYGVEEVCLNVMQEDNDQSMSEDSRRISTVEESDTWMGEGPVGLRRTGSWSSLGQRAALQRRSRSF